ncbi:MAG: hypothetical protein IH851_08495 [Armatimonadetes bacterium]|nr:hypothetical protein [Armatimonadota bacterium]
MSESVALLTKQELRRLPETKQEEYLLLIEEERACSPCLWPPPYNKPTLESRIRFVTECCKTWDPTPGVPDDGVTLIPDKPFIRTLCWFWHNQRMAGEQGIIRKSRRMIVSNTICALELHDAGLQRSEYHIGCQDYEDSAEMIWRPSHMYEWIQRDHPEWNLPDAKKWRGGGPHLLNKYQLPNGSLFLPLTGTDPDTFRQTGATGVRIEEGAFFARLGECLSNARLMCQGRPGTIGGLVMLVSTVNGANETWKKLTKVSTPLLVAGPATPPRPVQPPKRPAKAPKSQKPTTLKEMLHEQVRAKYRKDYE